MVAIIEMLKGVPSSLWGILIGSLLSLSGIYFTNSHNLKRMLKQFDHERGMKRADRERSMFQEIYLQLSEVLADQINIVMRCANMNIKDDELFANNEKRTGILAKASLISDDKTRSIMSNLSGDLTSTYLRLSLKRISVSYLQGQIEFYSEKISESLKKQDELNNLMAQYNLEGKNDPRRFKFLQESFEFQQQQFKELNKKRDVTFEAFGAKQMELLSSCFDEVSNISRMTIPLIVELRHTLELDTDEQNLRSATEKQLSQQREAIQQFSAQLSEMKKSYTSPW